MPPRRIDPGGSPHPITVVPLDERDEFALLTDESPPALEDPWNFSDSTHTSPQPGPDQEPPAPTHRRVARPFRAAAPVHEPVPPRTSHEVELPLQEFGVLNRRMARTKAQKSGRLVSALLVTAVAAVVAFVGSPWFGRDLRMPALARPALDAISRWGQFSKTSGPSVHVPAAPGEAGADRAATTADQAIANEPSASVPSEPSPPPTAFPKAVSPTAGPTATSGPADGRGRTVITARETPPPVSSQSVAVADAESDAEPDPATVAVVRDVLQQFRRGYEDLNLFAVRQVWPAAAAAELEPSLEGVQSQRVSFDDCSVRLRGDAASAACRGNVQQTLRTGGGARRVEGRVWIFTLRRVGTGWEIVAVRYTSFPA